MLGDSMHLNKQILELAAWASTNKWHYEFKKENEIITLVIQEDRYKWKPNVFQVSTNFTLEKFELVKRNIDRYLAGKSLNDYREKTNGDLNIEGLLKLVDSPDVKDFKAFFPNLAERVDIFLEKYITFSSQVESIISEIPEDFNVEQTIVYLYKNYLKYADIIIEYKKDDVKSVAQALAKFNNKKIKLLLNWWG